MRRGSVNENDLRAAMRASMTLTPPPPMESAAAVAAGRRAVRRRATFAGAGATAAVIAVAAVAVHPAVGLLPGGDGTPWAGAGFPAGIPVPFAGGDNTKPAWPLDGDGKPQEDATARSGERYEQGRKLLAELLAGVPDGWSTPTGKSADGIPLRDHQAQVEGDNTGSTWGYLARVAVAKDGRAGQLLAEVRTRNNGLPTEPCALARQFRGVQGDCHVVTAGKAEVAVSRASGGGGAEEEQQWAAYRHPDGIVVYVAQRRQATNGENAQPPLQQLPLTESQLATLATDARFHLE
jgi:hypothetical protein